MLLLADIGNTNITIGFYDNGFKNVWRLNTIPGGRDVDEYRYLLKGYISRHRIKEPEGSVLCSVVPQVTPVFAKAMKKCFNFEPLHVTYKLKTGLKFCIKKPADLGADRIANAAAARKLYKGHLIVIDFGTATTFCVISEKGEYKGGAIMPGPGMSAQLLFEKTAKLPKVELKPPNKTIGDDTESNILSGIIFGHAGAVERIIREIKAEIVERNINVIATGGYAHLIAPYIRGIKKVNPLLTLEGLRIIYKLNKQQH